MSIVLISWSGPSLTEPSLFLSLREENKLTLLRGNVAVSSQNIPRESRRPFRDTCSRREGRSRPAPQGSALADAHLVAFFCSLAVSGAAELKRELKLNIPSDTGLCLQGPSCFVLLAKQRQKNLAFRSFRDVFKIKH